MLKRTPPPPQRYHILVKNKLVYLKKRNDTAAAGFVPLPPGFQVNVLEDGAIASMRNCFTVGENGDWDTRQVCLFVRVCLKRSSVFLNRESPLFIVWFGCFYAC